MQKPRVTISLCTKLITCVSIIALAGPSYAASESQMEAKIEKLEAEIDQLKLDLKATRSVADDGKQMASEKPKVTLGPGLKVETADGETSFKIGGFLQMDGANFDNDQVDHPNGTTARRARLNASGTIAKDWKYKLEADFANTSNNNNATITDAFVQYDGFAPFSVTAGQFKEPFGLETLTSDLFTNFIERASTFAFSPDREIGVMFSDAGDSAIGKWTAAVGGFGGNISTSSADDEPVDITGRVTLAPIAEKDKVLHLGVAASHRLPDSATNSYQVRSKAENSIQSLQSVDTGTISGVDNVDLLGFEAAGVWGPASIQGEYVKADVDRPGAASPTFDGYYIEASYFLTGESRNYVAGTGRFDRTTPAHPFSLNGNGWGSWQIMVRHGSLDLNDPGAGFNFGKLSDTTYGIRWQPVANVAVIADYIRVNTDGNAVTANDDPDIWLGRVQFDF